MDRTLLMTWPGDDSGHNKLDLERSLKQLYNFMNAKLVDGAKDIVRAEASKGNIRGARVWKRV